MKIKSTKTPVALVLGTAFAASMVASSVAMAGTSNSGNPFAMTELPSGYMQVAEKDGKCGEGKCGEGKAKKEGKCGEGKCGEGKAKKEGKCGEGKCGEGKSKKEGKCGEGKCGGSK